jgi:HEAT repeat protein
MREPSLFTLVEVGFCVICGTLIVAGVVISELARPYERWRKERAILSNAKQSPGVQNCLEQLVSGGRRMRLEAARLLGELEDRTAVPGLLRAMERSPRDAHFLEAAVVALARLGDPRALPALNALARNHNHSLMAAARQAIDAIEPQAILLRGAPGPAPAAPNTLLRPAGTCEGMEASHELLRAGQDDASPG